VGSSDFDHQMKERISLKINKARKKRDELLDSQRQEREEGIYSIIKLYSIGNGIPHQRLADIVELDRKSIRPYIRSLMEKDLVRKNEQNGWYISTESYYKDPIFKAEVFGDSFQYKLRNKNFQVLNNVSGRMLFSPDQKKMFQYDFTKYKELFEPKFSQNNNIEKILFEFSNQIGAFITYLMIYCMNPDNKNNNTTNFSREESDRITQKMFQTAMNQITPYLIIRFRDFLNNMSNIDPTKDNNKIRDIHSKESSKYYLQKDIVIKLLESFVRIYPIMTLEFERILDKRYFFKEALEGWPSAIEGYKKWLISYNEDLKKQETCKHEFGKSTESVLYFGKIIQQCSKCKYIKNMKKTKLKK
jgi:predicted transcriptional regulator